MSKINIRFGATPGASDAALQELSVAREKPDGTTFPSLRGRLDELDASLSEIPNLEKYKISQNKLFGTFLDNFHDGTPQKIICQGDSLTFGQDLFSPDKAAYTNDATAEAGSGTTTIAATTYPQALAVAVSRMGFIGDLKKRAVGGATVLSSYNQWTTNPNAQLHIFMFGHNDSYTGVSISDFINNYINLIKRSLDWNSAVVLLAPPPSQNYTEQLNLFRNITKYIAKLFNIPCFDTKDFIDGYANLQIHQSADGTTISDGVHFNSKGYMSIGYGVAGKLFSMITNPVNVTGGDSITVNPYNGNVLLSAYPMPQLLNTNSRVFDMGDTVTTGKCLNIPSGGGVSISINALQEDLCLIPVYQCDINGVIDIELNFNLGIQRYEKSTLYPPVALKNKFTASIGEVNLKKPSDYTLSDIDVKLIRINKGVNTIYISNPGTGANSSANFHGFYVVKISDLVPASIPFTALNSNTLDVHTAKKIKGTTYLDMYITNIATLAFATNVASFTNVAERPSRDIFVAGVARDTDYNTVPCVIKIGMDGNIQYLSRNTLGNTPYTVYFNALY